LTWTIERVAQEFGEDVIRDVVRDINDLMCGKAGRGYKANRIGVAPEIWTKLLRHGGYGDSGVAKALAGEDLLQGDAIGAFMPYTIHTATNIVDEKGGPITAAELNDLLLAALRYRQLVKE
jgi:hypothetical protein